MVDFAEAIKKGVRACLGGGSREEKSDLPVAAVAQRGGVTATVLVCTPDIDSAITRTCLDSVRKYTTGVPYELLVFENGRFGKFQHPLEVNRALEIAQGDVLVTLDDDVELTEGWLEAMIAAAESDEIGSCSYSSAISPSSSARSFIDWNLCSGFFARQASAQMPSVRITRRASAMSARLLVACWNLAAGRRPGRCHSGDDYSIRHLCRRCPGVRRTTINIDYGF
jgi:hypothetical protein